MNPLADPVDPAEMAQTTRSAQGWAIHQRIHGWNEENRSILVIFGPWFGPWFFPQRKKMRSYWPKRKWTKAVHVLLHLGSHQAPDKSLKIIQQMCQMAQNNWHKCWDSSILMRPELLNVRYCMILSTQLLWVPCVPFTLPIPLYIRATSMLCSTPCFLCISWRFWKMHTGNVEVLSILGIIDHRC